MSQRLFVACFCCLLSSTAFAADKHIVRPCDPKGAAYANARAELDAIDEAIGHLGPGDDFQPLVERLRKLVDCECFELLGSVDVDAKSALSLRTYWDGGASSRVRDALDWGQPGSHLVWSEPSVRRALTLETAPQSPLRALLCPAADETCAAETRGWELRADAAFELAAARDAGLRKTRRLGDSKKGGSIDIKGDDCSEAIAKLPAHRRFSAFRDCIEGTDDKRVALPIGHLRAPTRGWLVISGRRGHYDFCDETRVYDLKTGSAYRVGTCTSLALLPKGAVDHRATDDGRHPVVELGHVPVDALRETAWMLLLMDEVDREVRVEGWGQSVPKGVAIKQNRSSGFLGSLSGWGVGGSWSSGDTWLRWRIGMVDGEGESELKAGELTWPEERDQPERHHALTLLKVAEAGFHRDCPEAAPPLALVNSPALAAHKLDTDQTSLARAATLIEDTWQQALAEQKICNR